MLEGKREWVHRCDKSTAGHPHCLLQLIVVDQTTEMNSCLASGLYTTAVYTATARSRLYLVYTHFPQPPPPYTRKKKNGVCDEKGSNQTALLAFTHKTNDLNQAQPLTLIM